MKDMSQKEFAANDNIDRFILLTKIYKGQQEIKEGRGLTTEQAKKKLKKWLK